MLALAGGGEPAPSFAECARTACRNANCDWQSVQQTAAVLVDQLAGSTDVARCRRWMDPLRVSRSVRVSPTLEDCCRQMLERLLERGTPQEAEQDRRLRPRAWLFAAASTGRGQRKRTRPFDPPNSVWSGSLVAKGSCACGMHRNNCGPVPDASHRGVLASGPVNGAGSGLPRSSAPRETPRGSGPREASPSVRGKSLRPCLQADGEESRLRAD